MRIGIDPAEWLLACVPAWLPGGSPVRRRGRHVARELAASRAMAPPASAVGRFAIVRVPPAVLDPLPALAALHHGPGRTVIYCPEGQISAAAAAAVSRLVSDAPQVAAARRADSAAQVRIRRVPRGHFPAGLLFPVITDTRGSDVTVWLPGDLITAGTAAAISTLSATEAEDLQEAAARAG